jgi:hypothetical protein
MKDPGVRWAALLLVFAVAGTAQAAGDAGAPPEAVRPVPPRGIAVPETDRRALEDGLSALAREVRRLRQDPQAAAHVADVEIFYQAVRIALDHDEFFVPEDLAKAKKLLATGTTRARQLASRQTPWLATPGPTALGYLSALDGSVQPYGVYLPQTFSERSPQRWRLDTWFHGRDERLSEVKFVDGVLASGGPFTRPDALVLLPYGRFCNGSKLAGEVDFFEALADLRRRFRIDDDRIVIRGFSLGGASAWHLGAHFAWQWAAVAPGAGFSETPVFLRTFEKEALQPAWWQEKLYQLYDAPAYAENFRNVPVVAYSGEIDKQKQAADLMAGALARVGVPLVHVIGPQTAHKYHPDAVVTINRLVDALAGRGRDPLPRRVSLATPTLKYNRQAWVVVDALERHWEHATVEAELGDNDNVVTARTHNVTALTLDMPSGLCPFAAGRLTTVRLDGQRLAAAAPRSDRSWTVHFRREGGRWKAGELDDAQLRKRHDLQGPIDDAFMSSFVIVTPSKDGRSPAVDRWVKAEQMRAIGEWRRQLRGEPRVRRDIDLPPEEIAAHNLVLWGDPSSNKVLEKIAGKLPIQWTAEGITAGKKHFPGAGHALMAIYPNPLNPRRYVVLNSGVTFREYDYLNNARQIPKLPDWAVVDVTTPPDSHFAGKIVEAGFFGERWELITNR